MSPHPPVIPNFRDVSSKTHRIYLRGGGLRHTKIAREAVNLTSRLLDKFRKRKWGHDDSSEEERVGSMGMDVDYGAASTDPDFEAAIPTTRPRVLQMCNDSDDEEDSNNNIPSLVFEDSDPDPELDEELLTRKELTNHELLEGEFMAEEMVRATARRKIRRRKI
ncbi:hypothetical protein B0H14DRAFT_2582787 [Mycena olivaceomarginata]|nr:hypothetical protein B0H14DRAFT_2582787 [Mycena olivaceomarginata]